MSVEKRERQRGDRRDGRWVRDVPGLQTIMAHVLPNRTDCEVFMKDSELYANAVDDEGDDLTFRLYPTGENEFGRKRGMLKLKFGDGCLMFDDHTCKKL